jgi:hypothetical protein
MELNGQIEEHWKAISAPAAAATRDGNDNYWPEATNVATTP